MNHLAAHFDGMAVEARRMGLFDHANLAAEIAHQSRVDGYVPQWDVTVGFWLSQLHSKTLREENERLRARVDDQAVSGRDLNEACWMGFMVNVETFIEHETEAELSVACVVRGDQLVEVRESKPMGAGGRSPAEALNEALRQWSERYNPTREARP